jgi:replication factor C small subunit
MTIDDVWTIKYAPSDLDSLILSDQNRGKINEILTKGLTTNLMLLGPSGIGKTSLSKLITNHFAPYSNLYLNGSEDNGIDIVRSKISSFVNVCSIDGTVKIVRIEEFDGFSKAAQQALREIMESNLDDTKFIITGNEEHKIIDAVKSRCKQIVLIPDIQAVKKLIVSIIKKENIKVSEDQKEKLIELIRTYSPDIRKILNELQGSIVDGKFVFSEKKNTVAENVIAMIKKQDDLFTIRQYVINSSDDFSNNYHKLMRDMYDIFIKEKNVKAIRFIPYYMGMASQVADQEVNFMGLLFNLPNNI